MDSNRGFSVNSTPVADVRDAGGLNIVNIKRESSAVRILLHLVYRVQIDHSHAVNLPSTMHTPVIRRLRLAIKATSQPLVSNLISCMSTRVTRSLNTAVKAALLPHTLASLSSITTRLTCSHSKRRDNGKGVSLLVYTNGLGQMSLSQTATSNDKK